MKDKKDKIYYFQEKSNDILDLQDDLTTEEIGIYFILKAGYYKYSGELTKENIYQRCKFFGDKAKMDLMISKIFDLRDELLINNNWLSEVNGIKELSKKRKEIAENRWSKESLKKNPEKPRETLNENENENVNKDENDNFKGADFDTVKVMEIDKIKTKKFDDNPIYKKLSDDLAVILENKLQRKLSSKNWEDEIKKLIEKDLSIRQNPIKDVEQAIQIISNNYGKEYFPVIQSAKSLREKFTKIEDYVKRSNYNNQNRTQGVSEWKRIIS